MKAVDTNILARFLVKDDAAQAAIAEQLMRDNCYISLTVLLETAWVLASRFGQSRQAICDGLVSVTRLPNVSTVDSAQIQWAIDRFAAGADFADMLHLIDSRSADSFVTFDRGVSKGAGADAPIAVETLQA